MWPWTAKRSRYAGDQSVLGAGVRVKGEIESDGELEIRGQVIGDIYHAGRLVIAPGARCASNILADQLVIAGEVRGNVTARDQLELLPTGQLFGDATCARLMVAPGAVFQGATRMAQAPAPPALPAPREMPAARESQTLREAQSPREILAPRSVPLDGPLAILSEPLGEGVREPLISLGVHAVDEPAPRRAPATDAPAFSGGFSA